MNCPICNARVEQGARFCTSCGCKLEDAPISDDGFTEQSPFSNDSLGYGAQYAFERSLSSCSGFATASIVLGAMGVLLGSLLFSVLGLIFSGVSKSKIKQVGYQSYGYQEFLAKQNKKASIGLGLAIAGVVVSIVFLVILWPEIQSGSLNSIGSGTGAIVSSTWG